MLKIINKKLNFKFRKHCHLLISVSLLIFSSAYAIDVSVPNNIKDNSSFSIIDAKTESNVYSLNADTPRLIASNMKVITSYVALKNFGNNFTWKTKLGYSGKIYKGILHGNLYIIGSGDPTFTSESLTVLLLSAKKHGIYNISGKVIYDGSIFNHQVNSSELYPEPFATYSADPAGLLIDKNISKLQLNLVDHNFELESNYIQNYQIINKLKADESINSACLDTNNYISITQNKPNTVILSGILPASCSGKYAEIFLLDNDAYNKALITNTLANIKIINSGVESGISPKNLHIVAINKSANITDIITVMNQQSDNLYAKTLLLSIGAYKTKNHNTYEDGKQVYLKTLSKNQLNFNELESTLENGAGLSRNEQLTTAHISKLLETIYSSPESSIIIHNLPTPSKDGTLRYEFPQFTNQLYAKTGSLSDTKAYSGYFFAKNGNIYIVSAVINNVNTKTSGKQQLQDFKTFFSQILTKLNNQ
ncbi:MAG: D-alanyl-D-alanine carboxypeptidase/D-alanyl-D-alanine-endopeptidase [Burkholderiales bacterium]|nr:D-alanyl-D-alanine carboxypeptidase/D-alanyl-D-alanine-endopeptidase [Burkholderiales bacterium]